MDYKETITYLYQQLPQYQKVGKKAYKADLNNILALAYIIGDPHKTFKSIHIAGTNGKGSTAHMLASIFQENGYTTGLYTSPHLKDFRERVKVNGKKISKKSVVDFVEKYKSFFDDIKPSFFEWTVALAFYEFAHQKVDIAIIETGLGGRLDSTNIIEPELSIITNIGYDHQSILGNTLPEIASEKAGIIKYDTPVIIGETQEEIQDVFINRAKEFNAPIFFADQATHEEELPKTDLKGAYQKKNVLTVLQAIRQLKFKGWKLKNKQISKGFLKVQKNTGLLGRWQVIGENPYTVLDVSHNIAGIEQALNNLKEVTYKNLYIVIGLAMDKDIKSILEMLPKDATYYFTSGENERLMPAKKLMLDAVVHNLRGKAFNKPKKALKEAKKNASSGDAILVLGSNFVIAELV